MPFIETQTLRVHYEQAGSGRNALVLVHGNFASSRWWKPVLDSLPAGWRAYAPDLRGCGRTESSSSGVPSEFAIPRLADDLAEFVERLDLPAFHLVGHSLGGAVALQLALGRPERVRSLTLVAPAPADGLAAMRKGHSPYARMLRAVDPGSAASMFALREGYRVHSMLGTNRVMLRRALPNMMPGAAIDPPLFEALLDDAARIRPETVVGFLQALDDWNVEQDLQRLEVPTLIFAGGKDTLVATEDLERMARLMPSGELLAWPGVGHSPQLERPEEFMESLMAWLARSQKGAFWRSLRRFGERLSRWSPFPSRSDSMPAAP
jgi:pimeloyl-ACP methyl ester carboxylesterase